MRRLLPCFVVAALCGCVEENLPLLPEGGGGQSTCGGTDCDGACTSLDDDPLNCGACGHDCLGGACDDGFCQPVVLVTDEVGAAALAIDDTHLYWGFNASQTGIKRSNLDGSDKETLSITTNAQPFRMVVDDTHLYWTRRQGAHTVMRMPKNGGAESKLADATFPTGIAVDAEFVYWTNYWNGSSCATGEIRKMPLAGGESTLVSANENCPNSVVTGGGRILWSNEDVYDHVGKIRAWSVSGVQTLAAEQGRPAALATDGTHVYWAAPLDGTVMRAPFDYGEPETLVSDEQSPGGALWSGGVVYWMSEQSIRSVPATGGSAKTVYHIGVDAGLYQHEGSFYWVESVEGRIVRLVMPL